MSVYYPTPEQVALAGIQLTDLIFSRNRGRDLNVDAEWDTACNEFIREFCAQRLAPSRPAVAWLIEGERTAELLMLDECGLLDEDFQPELHRLTTG